MTHSNIYPIKPLSVSAICIPTTNGKLGGEQQPLVNARDLHEFLESKQEFANWIKSRIKDYQFIENTDYKEFLTNLSKTSFFGGRPKKDYLISLDMAKELAMVERNDKGRLARRYFIEMEKRQLADMKAGITDSQAWLIDDLQDAYLAADQLSAKLVRYWTCGALSGPEIAKLLDINNSTVYRRLRALNRLGLVQYPRPDDYTQTSEQQVLPFVENKAIENKGV